ncbi:TolC family outer membrane protein [Methyloversatilis thermotolerans]|uniref:TolC family outer membrane protein n=1 Tax=Methyloversatilis thermotolerans TaxID=1346290 RepID=UPI001E42120B|nr:TolC family outer membrane protein [Methyloversatilis thermotolerans]
MKPSMSRLTLAMMAGLFTLPASAADLLAALRDALSNDAQYLAARAQRDATAERKPQALAGLLPTLTLSGNSIYNDTEVTKPFSGSAQYNSNAWTLQLTQPLFRWQNWVQYEQGELQVAGAEATYAQARQDLMLRVAQAYFDLLYAQDVLTSIQSQKTAAKEQLELAERSFEVGTVTITDVHEAQSRYDLAGAQEIAAMNDIEVKRYALMVITGKDSGRLQPLRGDAEPPRPQPDDMQSWVSSAEDGNFAVASQVAALEVARREVRRQQAGHLPTVDIVATRGENKTLSVLGGAPTDIEQKNSTIGLQFSVPLFQGLGQQSRVRESAHLLDKAQSDLDAARRNAAQSARQAYLGVVNGMSQTRALQAALRSSTSALESNKLGYEVGVRINIDVLNAQQQLYATRRDLAKARYDTLLAQLRLKAAAGQLGDDDFMAMNALLEATPAP